MKATYRCGNERKERNIWQQIKKAHQRQQRVDISLKNKPKFFMGEKLEKLSQNAEEKDKDINMLKKKMC